MTTKTESTRMSLIARIDRRVRENQEPSPEAAAAVAQELNAKEAKALMDEYGSSILTWIYDAYIGSLRHNYKGQQSNVNTARVSMRPASRLDVLYMCADGYYKPLGKFALKDVEFQIGIYSDRIGKLSARMQPFITLKDEFEDKEAPDVTALYAGREEVLEELFRYAE